MTNSSNRADELREQIRVLKLFEVMSNSGDTFLYRGGIDYQEIPELVIDAVGEKILTLTAELQKIERQALSDKVFPVSMDEPHNPMNYRHRI